MALSKKKRTLIIALFAMVAAAGLLVLSASRIVAPVPPMFDESVTLEQASAAADANGQFVLAVATFDYCIGCQNLKRNTLSDDRVESWVSDHARPVYLKMGRDDDAIEALRTRCREAGIEAKLNGLPMVVLLKDGTPVAARTGFVDVPGFVKFLDAGTTPAEAAPAETPTS